MIFLALGKKHDKISGLEAIFHDWGQHFRTRSFFGIVKSIIKETGATTMADFGKVMPQVMKKGAGKIDGSMAQAILKSKLS